MIQAYKPDLDSLLGELAQYLNESDLSQVRQIVAEAQERIERFTANSNNSSTNQ